MLTIFLFSACADMKLSLWLVGAMVARLTPDQKAGCSSHSQVHKRITTRNTPTQLRRMSLSHQKYQITYGVIDRKTYHNMHNYSNPLARQEECRVGVEGIARRTQEQQKKRRNG